MSTRYPLFQRRNTDECTVQRRAGDAGRGKGLCKMLRNLCTDIGRHHDVKGSFSISKTKVISVVGRRPFIERHSSFEVKHATHYFLCTLLAQYHHPALTMCPPPKPPPCSCGGESGAILNTNAQAHLSVEQLIEHLQSDNPGTEVESSLAFLVNAAATDPNAAATIAETGIPAIVQAMQRSPPVLQIQIHALSVLTNMSSTIHGLELYETSFNSMVAAGVVPVCITVIYSESGTAEVLDGCCKLLSNLTQHGAPNSPSLSATQQETLVTSILHAMKVRHLRYLHRHSYPGTCESQNYPFCLRPCSVFQNRPYYKRTHVVHS